MLKELIDLLKMYINYILPFAIVYQYQRGIRLRLGRMHGNDLLPGLHWKIPFADVILTENAVETTMTLPAQSVQTEDGIEIVVKGVIGYRIDDLRQFLCVVWDTRDALADKSCAIIKELVAGNQYDVCVNSAFDDALTKLIQKRVKQYGIKILYVALTDITRSRSFRLFNENIPLS